MTLNRFLDPSPHHTEPTIRRPLSLTRRSQKHSQVRGQLRPMPLNKGRFPTKISLRFSQDGEVSFPRHFFLSSIDSLRNDSRVIDLI